MRRNHAKRARRDRMETYDCAYVELAGQASVARVIVIPMKTIFINIASVPEANVDRLFHNVEDAQEYLERWGVRFM